MKRIIEGVVILLMGNKIIFGEPLPGTAEITLRYKNKVLTETLRKGTKEFEIDTVYSRMVKMDSITIELEIWNLSK